MLLVLFSTLALVCTALIAGVHLTGPAFLNTMLHELEASDYVRLKRIADAQAPKLARPLVLAALVLTSASAITAFASEALPTGTLLAVGLLGLIVTLLAIIRGDLPINRVMAEWMPEAPPENWRAVRDRWERFFALRVVSNLVALGALVAAVCLR